MAVKTFNLESSAVSTLHGRCQVPGDKSISHRALIFSAIARGQSVLSNFLQGADCIATLKALRALGVNIQSEDKTLQVQGVDLNGLKAAPHPLDCGNSGTTMRLLAGLLCGQKFPSTLVGDASLSRRPMQRIALPLSQMGAAVSLSKQETAPVEIKPVQGLHGIAYHLPIASAQVKSALLIAALYAQGTTRLSGKIQTRDHTERMMQSFACELETTEEAICLNPGQNLQGRQVQIPGDLSSAAFLIVAALITENSAIHIENVGVNPTRNGVLHILEQMGAKIRLYNQRAYGAEPVADIEVHASSLKGIVIPRELVASTIDEFPILFIAAACAQGVTQLCGAEELREKESDRIDAMARGLRACGVVVETQQDGMTIQGGKIEGGQVNSCGDHRVAMAFLVAGLVADQPVQVRDCVNIETSFPGFSDLAQQLGFHLCRA